MTEQFRHPFFMFNDDFKKILLFLLRILNPDAAFQGDGASNNLT